MEMNYRALDHMGLRHRLLRDHHCLALAEARLRWTAALEIVRRAQSSRGQSRVSLRDRETNDIRNRHLLRLGSWATARNQQSRSRTAQHHLRAQFHVPTVVGEATVDRANGRAGDTGR